MIRNTLDAGIVFLYGLMLDVVSRPLADLRAELDFIVGTHEIPLPSYICIPAPILSTPFFYECLEKDMILPNTKVRDLDGTTLSVRPHDPMGEVIKFIRDIQSLRGYGWRVARHSLGFARRYHTKLTVQQIAIALTNGALICAPVLTSMPTRLAGGKARTHISTTEPLDVQYTPAWNVAARYERWFRPTMVTDEAGRLSDDVAGDILAQRPAAPQTGYLISAARVAAASGLP